MGCSIGIGALAAFLAFYRVTACMPWADEMQTVGYCLGSWGDGLRLATHSQNMPVGYWLLSKILLSITGPNFTTMRVASGVGFVLFAVLAFRLLIRWSPATVALMATLTVVLHPALVWHARDGRVYAILLLVETASVALMIARPFRGRAALWVLTSAGMVYLHHHALFVLAIEVLVILDRRLDLRRAAPWALALAAPDLMLVYLAMGSPNVASQVFGAGQTFAPNLLMAVDRIGAGIPEMMPLPPPPLPQTWCQALGGGILLVATVITAIRGKTVHSWLGLGAIWLLIVPAAAHDALDVFYDPRFIVVVIPLVLVWLMGALTSIPSRWPALIAAAGLSGVFIWTDLNVIRPHISPYRPATKEMVEDIASRPGKIVVHPGYLIGCWPLPDGFKTAGGVVLSETGAMVGVEKEMADENAGRYSPEMPWSRFRREVVGGESFTVIQGAPGFYPRQQISFAVPDEPWETGYRCRRLWPDYPFATIIRFERTR
ncbi:MAG: hypothetical protein JXQ73_04490 [Phycisphaerae bacterium]|nr:hypothetical protein [Phycisphaerae bacterium]